MTVLIKKKFTWPIYETKIYHNCAHALLVTANRSNNKRASTTPLTPSYITYFSRIDNYNRSAFTQTHQHCQPNMPAIARCYHVVYCLFSGYMWEMSGDSVWAKRSFSLYMHVNKTLPSFRFRWTLFYLFQTLSIWLAPPSSKFILKMLCNNLHCKFKHLHERDATEKYSIGIINRFVLISGVFVLMHMIRIICFENYIWSVRLTLSA